MNICLIIDWIIFFDLISLTKSVCQIIPKFDWHIFFIVIVSLRPTFIKMLIDQITRLATSVIRVYITIITCLIIYSDPITTLRSAWGSTGRLFPVKSKLSVKAKKKSFVMQKILTKD